MSCQHHWIIEDNEKYHQIGKCAKCGKQKDFGINLTIVTSKWLITTEDGAYGGKYPYAQEREYEYPKPESGFCVPFEPSVDDEGYWENLKYVKFVG